MEGTTALALAQKISELVQQCASFQAKYGRYYTLKPGSPAEAWAMYHDILGKQVEIAVMLDANTLDMPHTTPDQWWKRHDVIDLTMAKTLMQQVSHLIATCAYHEADIDPTDWSYAVYSAQASIAGMLHPSARMLALSTEPVKSERYVG
jgi:hypothetical protein